MNEYIKNKIPHLGQLSPQFQEQLKAEAELASHLEVASDEDYKDFFYINLHAPVVAQELTGHNLSPEERIKLISQVYQAKNQHKVGSIYQLYRAVHQAVLSLGLPINKTAYPIGDVGLVIQQPYDRNKWLTSMREMYVRMQTGLTHDQAFQVVAGNWDKEEQRDFKNWMAFYQEKGHLVYKLANGRNFLEIGNGAFLPLDVNSLRSELPPAGIPDLEQIRYEEELAKQRKLEEKQRKLTEKEELDKSVKALIGRLNAAERLATTKGIDKVLGHDGFKQWLQALHALKREIQVAPLSLATIQDLIVKEANILEWKGHTSGSELFFKIAQMPEMPAEPEVPSEIPTDSAAPVEFPTEEPVEDAMLEFVKKMKGKDDASSSDDAASSDDNELWVSEDDLQVFAQVAPPDPAVPPDPPVPAEAAPDAGAPETPEASEEMPPGKSVGETVKDHAANIEEALKTVSLQDVIQKLEGVAYMYKNRELARQLLLADLMMHQLGVASLFPQLGEAIKSSLDSNSYVLTRVEDIIGRLRGAAGAPAEQVDLNAEPAPTAPGIEALKQNITEQENKEKERKERRKAMEETPKAPPGETPPPAEAPAPVPAPEELAGPAQVEAPPPPAIPPRT